MRYGIGRRGFLSATGVWGAGLVLGGFHGDVLGGEKPVTLGTPEAEKLGWHVGIAEYTFRRFSLYETLDMVAAMGVRCIEPAFFLKLDKNRPDLKVNESLSAADRRELKTRLADHGMRMLSFYSNVGDQLDRCREIFEFAKEMGVATLVAEPTLQALDRIEPLCEEYAINLAIHNHPKAAKSKYWKPEKTLAACHGRGKRIGVCCDTGHWVRSGLEPVECLKKLEGRIIALHLKDVGVWNKPEARDVPLGRGKAQYAAVLGELYRQRFQGVMSIEYEHDSPKLLEEVGLCVTYVENRAKELAKN